MTAIKRVLQGAQAIIFEVRNITVKFVSNTGYFSAVKQGAL